LRPIGNRPLPPSRWTGGGNQPPRRLPTCPTLVFDPVMPDYSTGGDRRQKAIVCPTQYLTGHARFREPESYAFIAGDRAGAGPGIDRVSPDIEYRPFVSHLLALRVAVGRAGFRYRAAHRDAAGGPVLLCPRLGADYRAGLRHTDEGR